MSEATPINNDTDTFLVQSYTRGYYAYTNRSRHLSCFIKKGVLKDFTNITEKFESLFLNKIAGPATLLKKRLWHRCFPVSFVKFSRTTFLQNTYERLLLP